MTGWQRVVRRLFSIIEAIRPKWRKSLRRTGREAVSGEIGDAQYCVYHAAAEPETDPDFVGRTLASKVRHGSVIAVVVARYRSEGERQLLVCASKGPKPDRHAL